MNINPYQSPDPVEDEEKIVTITLMDILDKLIRPVWYFNLHKPVTALIDGQILAYYFILIHKLYKFIESFYA